MTKEEEYQQAKKEANCDHEWVSLWSDYHSWGSECKKCLKSESGDF